MKKKTKEVAQRVYYKNPKIEVRKSKISGIGVFANKNIKEGEILEECHFLLVDMNWNKADPNLNDYIFCYGEKYTETQAIICFGLGSCYNHNDEPSAGWEVKKRDKMLIFTAWRDIKKGEEIFISYSKEYWTERFIKPKN